MISKAQIKLIKSLNYKKYRQKHKLFIAEGVKLVNELIFSEYKIYTIYATPLWTENNKDLIQVSTNKLVQTVSLKEIQAISTFKSPNKVIAIVQIPETEAIQINKADKVVIILESIRDPGNLGTIIRIADWYNTDKIICSPDCADIYNPKVIQASMGSLFHVKIYYENLYEFISSNNKLNAYAACLEGTSIHEMDYKQPALIVIGNESSGISDSLNSILRNKICIPRYGKAESLNASVATGIILDKISRDIN